MGSGLQWTSIGKRPAMDDDILPPQNRRKVFVPHDMNQTPDDNTSDDDTSCDATSNNTITRKRQIPTCAAEDCNASRPRYASPGETQGQFCKRHAAAGMINLSRYFCQFLACPLYANFGLPGELPQFCQAHSGPGMAIILGVRFLELSGSECIFIRGNF